MNASCIVSNCRSRDKEKDRERKEYREKEKKVSVKEKEPTKESESVVDDKESRENICNTNSKDDAKSSNDTKTNVP